MFKELLEKSPFWPDFCEPVLSLSDEQRQTDVLRLDKLDPNISGNKPLKLLGWVKQLMATPKPALLSFGGRHSNHLHALAHACAELNVSCVCVVRGWPQQPLTPTLQDCQALGATLVFADNRTYAKRYEPEFQAQLAGKYQALVIPEGGAGTEGEIGCQSLAELAQHYDSVWLAVGTGTTALGLAKGLLKLNAQTTVYGVNAVADQGERRRTWQHLMPAGVNWQLIDDAHFGGFGKCPAELKQFIREFELPLDPIYTAKLFYAFKQQGLPSKALLIHSGGLQGLRGHAL